MPQPTQFQDALERLGINSQRAILDTFDSMTAAGLPTDDVKDVLTPLLQRGALEGQALARGELAQQLAALGYPDVAANLQDVDPGSAANTAAETKRSALDTALDRHELPLQRSALGRLANSDPIQAGQDSLNEAMRNSSGVAGYVRVLDSDACELCGWLYRDGYVYPPQRQMTTHAGCLCTARAVSPNEVREAANIRYGTQTPGGGTSRSAQRRRGQELERWHARADYGARGVDPDTEWLTPPESRDNDLTITD